MAVSGWSARRLQVTVASLGLGAASALAGADGPRGLDPEQVESGLNVYQQYCASCHGPGGEGAANWEQPNAQGELPPPPHNAEGHTWKHADAMLYRMVSKGWRDPFNKTEGLTMPPFEDVLTPDEVQDVITYLKTLWTPEQRQFQWEETQVRGGFPQDTQAPKESK